LLSNGRGLFLFAAPCASVHLQYMHVVDAATGTANVSI